MTIRQGEGGINAMIFRRNRGKKRTDPSSTPRGPEDLLSELAGMLQPGGSRWQGTAQCTRCGDSDIVLVAAEEAKARYKPGGPKAYCGGCGAPIVYKWKEA
jgi:hypothetical protein